jgi:hypothetical protein
VLDQFERIFTPKLVEDLRRVDHPACTARGTIPRR